MIEIYAANREGFCVIADEYSYGESAPHPLFPRFVRTFEVE